MKFIKADFKDVEVIHSIVHSTIKEVYPKYYPEGVVDFFSYTPFIGEYQEKP